jgi:hypothetical protein
MAGSSDTLPRTARARTFIGLKTILGAPMMVVMMMMVMVNDSGKCRTAKHQAQ